MKIYGPISFQMLFLFCDDVVNCKYIIVQLFIHLCPYVLVVRASATLRSSDKPQSSAHFVFNK